MLLHIALLVPKDFEMTTRFLDNLWTTDWDGYCELQIQSWDKIYLYAEHSVISV